MNTVSNSRLTGGDHDLGVVSSCRHETLSFVLSVRPSWPSIATQYACVSLPEENGQDFQEFLHAKSRPPGNLGSTTGCVSMNTLLVKFHTLCLPELSEGPLMADGHHVLEEVASRRHEMHGPVLRVWTHAGLSGQHNAHVMWSRVMTLKLPVEETKVLTPGHL